MRTPKLPITAPSVETEGEPGADAVDSGAAADFQEMLQVLMRGAPPADPAVIGINAAADRAEEEHPGSGELLPSPTLAPALIASAAAGAVAAAGTRVMAAPENSAIATDGVSVKRETSATAAPMSGVRADPRSTWMPDARIGAGNDQFAANADATGNLSAAPVPGLPAQQADSAAADRDAAATAPPLPTAAPVLRGVDHDAASPASQPRIESPVGTAVWSGEFAQKVMWIAGDKQQSAELHLNPPELGPLSIRLAIDDDQASAIFHSVHSEVREAIQAALPRLREVLAESGIALGNASVTADSPREGSAFDRRQQPQSYASGSAAETAADDPAAARPRSNGSGLVNLFA